MGRSNWQPRIERREGSGGQEARELGVLGLENEGRQESLTKPQEQHALKTGERGSQPLQGGVQFLP